MAKNKFNWPKHEEFQVLDENGSVIGTVRIKPNALLWKPNNAKGGKPWFGITLEEFSEFAEQTNRKQAH